MSRTRSTVPKSPNPSVLTLTNDAPTSVLQSAGNQLLDLKETYEKAMRTKRDTALDSNADLATEIATLVVVADGLQDAIVRQEKALEDALEKARHALGEESEEFTKLLATHASGSKTKPMAPVALQEVRGNSLKACIRHELPEGSSGPAARAAEGEGGDAWWWRVRR
ncbi:hypothetical protein FB45DRAFT_14577 [Roridomyces roridus]|uniref:Uncharacterized protein n=1 Tax=Roridomyces roridus TaxID=1738132 RepID=A0AAD7CLK6_9AGAR|nr:hypothetical protein FB45DRAFT_14577 [Roridomyces roridus]